MTPSASIFTQAVHAGEREPAPLEIPVVTPLYHSVSYVEPSAAALDAVFAGEQHGYVYRRYQNPTVEAFERAVATLEQGEAGFAASSGMAAIHLALLAAGVRSGSAVLAAQDCYGATFSLLKTLLAEQGVHVHWVDPTDTAAVQAALHRCRPVCLLVETLSNPLLKLPDLPTLAAAAHEAGAALIVDNTFATPYLCRPLAWGADYVVHSASKYLAGHGDVLAGVIVTSAQNRERIFALQKLVGAVLAPEVAWLALRGLKTLPLRMERHCLNAARVADWLVEHPAVAAVFYPGLEAHPQHERATRLFGGRGFGGMVSFDLREATQTAAFRFLDHLQLVLPATTLGDVYSLTLYPTMTSHRSLSVEERAVTGIGDGLLRLSIGIEDVDDITADLAAALQAV